MFGNKLAKIDKLVEKKNGDALAALAIGQKQEIRLKAIAGMGQVGGDSCYNVLVTCLRDADPQVRSAAAVSLAQVGDHRGRGHLEHQLKTESDPQVREALRKALGCIHGD